MNEVSSAESIGYLIGSIIGWIIGIVIIGAIIAWIGGFIFPKSSRNKRFIWGMAISVGLSALSLCSRMISSI